MLFLCLFLPVIQAKGSVRISGGNDTGIGGVSSCFIGQIVYTAHSDALGVMQQEVQPPF